MYVTLDVGVPYHQSGPRWRDAADPERSKGISFILSGQCENKLEHVLVILQELGPLSFSRARDVRSASDVMLYP